MNIPAKLTHIWVGPNPPPITWMNTWPEKHPSWNYSIFSDDDLKNKTFYNQHLIDEYYNRNKFNGVADLIRYELLYEYGGFIPPADAVCLENTEELFVENSDLCYTVYENEIIRPGYVSPIYAACPKNHFLRIIIETLHQLEPAQLSGKVWESTGNLFLKNMIEKHSPKIKIFPSHYFIPKHFKAKTPRYEGPDKIYADQKWGTTKKTYSEGL
jgi:mannosyltransferase OCH1-like enzyme